MSGCAERRSSCRSLPRAACRLDGSRARRTNGSATACSRRSVIRCLSTHGPDCLTRPVAESMTRNVITCEETDTLDELMARMTERRFRHLPVISAHRQHGRGKKVWKPTQLGQATGYID